MSELGGTVDYWNGRVYILKPLFDLFKKIYYNIYVNK